jgi:excisionase family DNA binding protein
MRITGINPISWYLVLQEAFEKIPVLCYKVGMRGMLTTKEAAERLGVSRPRVNQLISEGRLPAEKNGRDYFIKPADLAKVKDRKPGRPKGK